MLPFGSKRRELLARTIADFTKAIFAVAVASQFFKEFPLGVRLTLGAAILIGVMVALFIQPEER
jgi:hypothetical protein